MFGGWVDIMPELVDKPAVDIQVSTLERVEGVLQAAGGPVSKTYIHAKLKEAHAGR